MGVERLEGSGEHRHVQGAKPTQKPPDERDVPTAWLQQVHRSGRVGEGQGEPRQPRTGSDVQEGPSGPKEGSGGRAGGHEPAPDPIGVRQAHGARTAPDLGQPPGQTLKRRRREVGEAFEGTQADWVCRSSGRSTYIIRICTSEGVTPEIREA